MPIGQLWVNPDGVVATGEAYAQQVALYEQYVAQLASLRDRYGKAWGDDDMGKEFSEKFLKGLDNLDSLIGGVKGTLNYTAEGLRESGKMYRDVDEGAKEAGDKMARDFEESFSSQPLARRAALAEERTFERGEVTAQQALLGEQTPLLRTRTAVQGKRLNPGEEPLAEGEGKRVFMTAQSMTVGKRVEAVAPVEGLTPLQPMLRGEVARQREALARVEEPLVAGEGPHVFAARKEMLVGERVQAVEPLEALQPTTAGVPMKRGVLAQGELLEAQPTTPGVPMSRLEPVRMAEPMGLLEPAHQGTPTAFMAATPAPLAMPAMPAISSYMSTPEYATAYVGGEPLPEGYRLEALNPFEDGSTRVDANLYESVTPLAGTPVTTPDGQPLDPEGRQFFVVKDNPAVDPTAPDYQPLVLSYSADGTPTPLI